MKINIIYNGNCLEIMKMLPDKNIDMILCDLPYGITNCEWDKELDIIKLWKEYERIIKDNSAIILTASQPFSSKLVISNLKMFKYEWIWEKSKASGYLNSKRMPLIASEHILVFYKTPPIYNPQKSCGVPYNKGTAIRPTNVYGKQTKAVEVKSAGERLPRNIIYFRTAESEGGLHPTQKPIALFEYLIKTYTNEGMLVLDNCIGSGTTGVAAKNTNRDFIGIELNEKYAKIAANRCNVELIKYTSIKETKDIKECSNCAWIKVCKHHNGLCNMWKLKT